MKMKTTFCPQITQINADFKAFVSVFNITRQVMKAVCFLICGNLRNLRIKVFPKINLALQEVRS